MGPYRILRRINRGGQGSVYLGYDKRLHRRVAIKIYHMPSQRAARKHLLREAQLVASIQSPKVVQIYDVIESSEHLALVMEYVPGCDLEELLLSVRPSLASILTIGADIAGALAVARQRHIVHGDLKAGNILITASGRVKLTDFGIARGAGESAPPPWAAGSLSALSPEQYLGRPLDERADLFALGCLLYRMLAGEQPFFRDGQFELALLLEQSPRPLEERVGGELVLPGQLVDLITALLQKDRQNRPANTRRVRQVLRTVAREIPLAASNSLLHEARPCFRPESVDDIPPRVPADLERAGRSRLAPGNSIGSRLRHRLALLSWPARSAVALAAAIIVSVPLVVALHSGETPIHFDAPIITFTADIDLPAAISSDWLVHEVQLALAEQLGVIHVIGPVGAAPETTLYSGGSGNDLQREPEETFQIALRCIEDLCVFAVSRERAGRHYHQQGVLLPDMPVRQWRDVVRGTTLALYP